MLGSCLNGLVWNRNRYVEVLERWRTRRHDGWAPRRVGQPYIGLFGDGYLNYPASRRCFVGHVSKYVTHRQGCNPSRNALFSNCSLPAFSLSDHEHCMNSSGEGRISSFVSRLNANCLAAIIRAVCARGPGGHERAAERHKLRWPSNLCREDPNAGLARG